MNGGSRAALRAPGSHRTPTANVGVDVVGELALVGLGGVLVDQLGPLGGLACADHQVFQLDEAAARELKEETGLLVDPADLSLVHVVHVEQGWDQAGQLVVFVFATGTWTGELINTEPNKHLTAQWVAANRLPEPSFPTTMQALAAYQNGGPVLIPLRMARHHWVTSGLQSQASH